MSTKRLLTSNVSLPPTMLSPSPELPFEISRMVSWPGTIGQVAGSGTTAGTDILALQR